MSDSRSEGLFRSQFERDGERYLFRYGRKGAPVPVTATEMEESVSAYLRRARWIMNTGVIAMMVAIAAFVFSGSNFLDRDGAIWLLILVWVIPFLIAFRWAWRSPTVSFLHRTPAGTERTRSEVRALMLSEWGWPKILLPMAMGIMLVGFRLSDWPPATIEGWIWFAFGVVLLVLGAFNAISKWRVSQT